jgi:hypothetical protein
MNNNFWLEVGKNGHDRILISQITRLKLEMGMAKLGQSIFFEADIIIRVHVIEPDDMMALLKQMFGQMKTNKSGGASDEDGGIIVHRMEF